MRQFLHNLHKVHKKTRAPGTVALKFSSDALNIVHIVTDGEQKASLRLCESIYNPDVDNLSGVLSDFCKKHKLGGANCHWVLPFSDYKLLLIDKPKVNDDEMAQAARWLVKELISFPLEDAAIDIFPMVLPTESPKVYAAIAQKSYLEQYAGSIRSAGFNLTKIGVSDLALRNIFTLNPEETSSVALLHTHAKNSEIILGKQDEFYLSRQLRTLLKASDKECDLASWLDEFIVEIQRSVDYFERHYRQPPPSLLYIEPCFGSRHDAIVQQLNAGLGLRVETLTLSPFLGNTEAISDARLPEYLPLIGSALGKGLDYHA